MSELFPTLTVAAFVALVTACGALAVAWYNARKRAPVDRAQTEQSQATTKLAEAQTESTQVQTLINVQTNLVARVDSLVTTNEALVGKVAEGNASLVLAVAAAAAAKLIEEDLKARIIALDAKVSALTATNTDQASQITTLTELVGTLQDRIVALDSKVADLTKKSGEDAAKIQGLLVTLNGPADKTQPTVADAQAATGDSSGQTAVNAAKADAP